MENNGINGKSLFRRIICLHYACSLEFCLVHAYEKDLFRLKISLLKEQNTELTKLANPSLNTLESRIMKSML